MHTGTTILVALFKSPPFEVSLLAGHFCFDTRVLMEYWDSKIPFLSFFELSYYQRMYGKLWLYLLQSCVCKVDNFMGCFLVSFMKKLTSRSANIILLVGNNVLIVTEGKDTIDHYEIIYAVLNVVVYAFVYQ